MGFSGNVEPSYIIPTCIGINDGVATGGARKGSGTLDDVDFTIGHEARRSTASRAPPATRCSAARAVADATHAPPRSSCAIGRALCAQALANASSQTVTWPIRHGQVENWDHMERYWQQCMFKCAPSARNRRCACVACHAER